MFEQLEIVTGKVVGVEIGRNQVIGSGLGGRIGAARVIGGGFMEKVALTQAAVDLVGRDVVE